MLLELITIIIFVATIFERLLELRISHQNAAWSLSQGGVEHGASHYKWMVLMHTAFLACMLLEYASLDHQIPTVMRWSAIVLVIFCQIIRWWIIQTLGRQWNTRVIVISGHERVRSGPYRFLSHPNYVVVAIETIVLPLMFGSWRTAIIFTLLNGWMMRVRIGVENAALKGLR